MNQTQAAANARWRPEELNPVLPPRSVPFITGDMCRSVASIAFISCLLVSTVSADPVRNGKWWQKLNYYQQQAYVTGVFDGISTEQLMMASDATSARVAQNQATVIQNTLGGITSDQIIARLKTFYQERRNSPVIVGEAVMLVAVQSRVKEKGQSKMFDEALQDARKRGAKAWQK